MKKVFLRFYSSMNLGDDLFVYIISKRYKNTFLIDRKAKRRVFRSYDNLKAAQPAWRYLLNRVRSRIQKKLRITDINAGTNADLFVYVGGSIFMEGNSLQRWREEKDFFASLQERYLILGANFGPYSSGEFKALVGDILGGALDVCFRDKNSYQEFCELKNVRQSADIAFTLDTRDFSDALGAKEKLALISVIDAKDRFDSATATKYELEITKLAEKLVSDGFKVAFLTFCEREGDGRAADRIRNDLSVSTEIYRYQGDLGEVLELIARSEVIIASRFHATILGLVFNLKVLPVVYSDKTINALADLDFSGPVLDIRKLEGFDGTQFDFDDLPITNVDDQRKIADSQFLKLDELLERN